jgi:hypothetical protein
VYWPIMIEWDRAFGMWRHRRRGGFRVFGFLGFGFWVLGPDEELLRCYVWYLVRTLWVGNIRITFVENETGHRPGSCCRVLLENIRLPVLLEEVWRKSTLGLI